jgi:photosystem II stability/assembly factor-like uncharacterized protein
MKRTFLVLPLAIFTGLSSCKKEEIVVPTVNVVTFSPSGSPSLFDIQFTSNDTGFIAASAGQVLRTTNGGTTWIPFEAATPDYEIKFISMVNSVIGYASGRNAFGRQLYKTTDGGTTWTVLSSSYDFEELEFADANNGFMIHIGMLYKTTTGGTYWSLANSFSNVDDPENLVFVSKDTGFVRDRSGLFYFTHDGGANWQSNQASSGFVAFVKDGRNSGYGFSANSVYYTSDRGATWESRGTMDQNYPVYSFGAKGSVVVYAGDDALVLSKDGGSTLTYYYDQKGESIMDNLIKSAVTPDQKIFCISNSGKVYKITF